MTRPSNNSATRFPSRTAPNTAWLCLRKDVFDRLDRYRRDNGLPTWERALERLLASAEEAVPP